MSFPRSKAGGIRLFVYGTLRRRGVANYYLESFPLIEEGIWVNGFAMYDAGWYPFAVPDSKESQITGDIYEVPESKIPELDNYEGPEYKKILLEKWKALIYIKSDGISAGYQKVPDGDWLKYLKDKSG